MTQAAQVARALGWFSIGLGAAEVAVPQQLSDYLGMNDRAELVRVFGLREIGAGIGILREPKQARWVWARVAGDALDLLVLASALSPDNAKRTRAGWAFGTVAAITVVDIICATNLSRGK